jgi:hypothetical protein
MRRPDFQTIRVKGHDGPFILPVYFDNSHMVLDPATREEGMDQVRTLARIAKELEMRLPDLPWSSPPPSSQKPGRNSKGQFMKASKAISASLKTLRERLRILWGERPWKFGV